MVADLHSSISKEPEMKAGDVVKVGREESPGYHRDTAELMDSRPAVCVANALDNCEPPTPTDVACQLTQEGEIQRDRKRERREEG